MKESSFCSHELIVVDSVVSDLTVPARDIHKTSRPFFSAITHVHVLGSNLGHPQKGGNRQTLFTVPQIKSLKRAQIIGDHIDTDLQRQELPK